MSSVMRFDEWQDSNGNPVLDGTGLVIPASAVSGALNASGSAPLYATRAWVNFNGTGTVAIRSSGNVSSVTDNGTGQYTVNFTTAMADANYTFTGCAMGPAAGRGYVEARQGVNPTTTALALETCHLSGVVAQADAQFVSIAIVR
jgi:hypothetical protein